MVRGVGERVAKVRVSLYHAESAKTQMVEDCLRLTKAMQRTAETLQSIADLYDDHVSLRLSRP
jgi:hypothetical protein